METERNYILTGVSMMAIGPKGSGTGKVAKHLHRRIKRNATKGNGVSKSGMVLVTRCTMVESATKGSGKPESSMGKGIMCSLGIATKGSGRRVCGMVRGVMCGWRIVIRGSGRTERGMEKGYIKSKKGVSVTMGSGRQERNMVPACTISPTALYTKVSSLNLSNTG